MTYTDYYPSGLAYVACGAGHPSGDPTRRCSRPVNESGQHRGRTDIEHMNDLGNQWAERRSGNERRSVPRWIEYTRADDRRGKALDHS